MKYIVETKGLCKSYGNKQVVRNVDLKVPKGCVYGFMGPNGAGKSTTLKMLLGLIKASSGKAEIAGKEMNQKNRLEILRETGSLIESPSYYGHLTGRENLEIVRTLKNAPEKEVDQVLKLVRIERQQNKKAREYSLGMKQRLGLAAALIGRPELLILDEPTNGLDPAGIQEIRELICELPKRMGITVLVSSHLLSEMDQMADYVGIINHGQLIFQDKLDALHEHSKSKLLLRVMNRTVTLKILENNGVEGRVTEEGILIPGFSDDRTAALVSALAEGGAGLYRIEERQKSLEDIFLSLTGRRESL
ncbi:ABC transporter ATP-binding protein [Lachnoclostridium sp. An138]|uniref:ABC transporter ATP-binding protein n=1 Tax=Lachnoclostridium sp. An138 TaxID=1965560 RepID=UPI000B38F21E|nr:ABC transporter ATP-binding protein [Lachnoclostridium sp. An138]OUQ18584.1 ABC transporter ATP-binding protein [Lachnoclostridium sp. An138]